MASDDDRDVARYVLAYLIEMNYSRTTAAFLEECDFLQNASSHNIMILPKTSLKAVINEYKARQNTGVMIKTLGTQQAWKSLWTKLQHTLEEISSLAQDSLPVCQNTANRSKKGVTIIKSQSLTKSKKPSLPTTTAVHSPDFIQSPQTTNASSAIPASSNLPLAPPVQETIPTSFAATLLQSTVVDNRSPRKKRMQAPKRKEAQTISVSPSVPGPSTDPSEDIQQLLGSLMCNEELPWRLAELINQHVGGNSSVCDSSPDLPAVMSDYVQTGGAASNSNAWLDDLINSVCPTETTPMLKPPSLNQEPLEAVSAEVISLLERTPDTENVSCHTPNSVAAGKPCKRQQPVDNNGEDQHVKRQKPEQLHQIYEDASTSDSSLRLPEGVNLEQFLDQIHK